MEDRIAFDDFKQVDIRVGTVREVRDFPEADKPLYQLKIDFGDEIGVLRSAAGFPPRYGPEELEGRQVLAAVNLAPRRIAGFVSECLTLGVPDGDDAPVVVEPDRTVPDGARLY